MTEAPDWAVAVPAVGVHNAPPRVPGPDLLQITWQQMQQVISGLVNEFLRQVAVALGAIEIFGFKPYQALVEIGEKIEAGVDNFNLLLSAFGLPTMDAVADLLANQANDFATFLAATGQATFAALGAALNALIAWLTAIPANLLSGALPTNVTLSGTQLGTLLQYLNSSGQYAAAQLTGALNTGLTFSGTALSTLLQYLNPSGQFAAAQLTGGINTAVTFGGTALSTLLQYLSSSGQFNAAQLTGGLNSAVTFGGTALSTFFGNINSSGGLLASGLTGAFNGAVTLGGNSFTTLLQYLNSSGQFAAGQLTGAINGGLTLGGVTLSTLVTNINSSGQILAAGITGALGTTLTVGGVQLGTLFTNINSSGQLLGAGITGALNVAATVAGQTLGTIQANAQGLVQGINNAAAGVTSGASSLLADAQTNLELLLGAAPRFLQGLGGGVFGQQATEDAYAVAAQARADQAAEQARIRSAFNAVFNVAPTTTGNVNLTIDFSGMANAANMSGVMSPGNTNMGITSGVAVRQVTTAGDDKEVFPTVTTSDYQVITVTLGSLNNGYALEIMGRCNSARTTYTCVNIQPGLGGLFNVNLAFYVSGTLTNPTYNSVALSSGGVLKFILGDPSSASPYAMQVLYNGTPIITYTDSSHVSQLGASYRYVGLRMVGLGSGQKPPSVRAVAYQDNPPPPAAYPFSGRPTASVDAKGRQYASSDCGRIDRDNGGAWENIYLGPLAWATAPPSSGWSAVNQGSTTFAADRDAMLLTAPSVASGESYHLWVRSLSPSSNYIATFYIEPLMQSADVAYVGLALRNSSSGAFIAFECGINTGYLAGSSVIRVSKWNNVTTVNSVYVGRGLSAYAVGGLPCWFRIRDDGSNRYFEMSVNGVDWMTFYSGGRTDFITPNQIGLSVYNGNTGQPVYLRLRSLSGVS